jgi:hypothetical protein
MELGLIIDFSKLDDKIRRAVLAIESKPHIRYIRYLLSKRYSPTSIKKELFRLGLSAPHEPNLTAYYLAVMDPIIKQYGLGAVYADYKNKLLKKNARCDFAKDILNYRLDLDGDLDGQVKFCKFAKTVEIDDLWMKELYNFYGAADRFPLDEVGNKILDITTPNKNAEKILIQPKRYLIDKMILENVADSRIAKYCREQFKLPINDYDIKAYKVSFFNIKNQGIEDKIKALEIERNSLESLLQDIENGSVDMDLGERMLIQKQTEQRKSELDDNIKMLNAVFSDLAFKQANANIENCEQMFLDVVTRAYTRFVKLDRENDRDVVDPLFKVARMMSFAHDKVESIRDVSKGKGNTDVHSQSELLELYKKRVDEVFDEQAKRANEELQAVGNDIIERDIDPNNIAGIEELGVSFEITENEQ